MALLKALIYGIAFSLLSGIAEAQTFCPNGPNGEATTYVYNFNTGRYDCITALYTCNSNAGIQFTDSRKCTWCETVNTSGVLSAALIGCPAGFILMESTGYVLQEDGSKIRTE